MKPKVLNKDYLLEIINAYLNGNITFLEEKLLTNYLRDWCVTKNDLMKNENRRYK